MLGTKSDIEVNDKMPHYHNIMTELTSNIILFQIWTFFGNLVAAYIIAYVTSLAFEAPMMGLEKTLLKRKKS